MKDKEFACRAHAELYYEGWEDCEKEYQEKIKILDMKIDDYQEFVKSANEYLKFESTLKAKSERDNDKHNLRVMCDYLMKTP